MFNNNERKRVKLISSDLTFWPSQRHYPCTKWVQSFVIFLFNMCMIKHVHKKPDLVCSNGNKALIHDLLSNFQVDNAWMIMITHVFTTIRGLLYVTVLNLYISNYRYLFGTATYVDYLMFSHLNPITNPTPLSKATLTIRATARNPNYRGSRVYPNYQGSCTQT